MTRWIKRSAKWLNFLAEFTTRSLAPPQATTQPLPPKVIFSEVGTTSSPLKGSIPRVGISLPDLTASPPSQALCFLETTQQRFRQVAPTLARENLATSLAPTAATPLPGAADESRRFPHHHRLQSLRLHRRLIQRHRLRHMVAFQTVNLHFKPSKAPHEPARLGATEGQRHSFRHLAAIKTVNFHLKPSKAPPESARLGATEGQRHRLRHLAQIQALTLRSTLHLPLCTIFQ